MLRNQSGNSTLILFQCSHFSKGQNVAASDGSKKGIWESNLCPAEGTLFLSQVKRDASALLHILTTFGLYLFQYHIFCILLKYILQSNMTMEGRMKFDKGETWKDEAVDLDSLLSADRVPWIHSSLYNQNHFFKLWQILTGLGALPQSVLCPVLLNISDLHFLPQILNTTQKDCVSFMYIIMKWRDLTE